MILKRIAVNAISNRLISVQIQIHKTDTELLSLWLKMHFFYLLKISALEFSLIFGVVIDMEVILVLHPRGKLLVGGFFFTSNSGSWRPTGTLIIDLTFLDFEFISCLLRDSPPECHWPDQRKYSANLLNLKKSVFCYSKFDFIESISNSR